MADKGLAEILRDVRVSEFFFYYDTIVIGPGAAGVDTGWFNSFAGLAGADRIQWFAGRNSSVGLSYSNTNYDRRDIAFLIDHMALEAIVPTTARTYVEQGCEAHAVPALFANELLDSLSLNIGVQGLDQILETPARRIPGGAGVSNSYLDLLNNGAFFPGNNGQPVSNNLFHFPEPREIPANSTFNITGRVDQPLRGLLSAYTTTPGFDNFPLDPPGTFRRVERWYKLRVTLFCRRRAQVRGGRVAG